MPAALPYYVPRGVFADPSLVGFTKALVFSSWQLVPKVIAVLGSYEAERRMVRLGDPAIEYGELFQRQRPLLRFAQDGQRLTGMPLFTLLYPCATLAREIDPLKIARSAGASGVLADSNTIASAAAIRNSRAPEVLDKLGPGRGPLDERWYWAALILLDRAHSPGMRRWLDADGEWSWGIMADDDDTQFAQHIKLASQFFDHQETLGRPPLDLFEVLANIALASPAVVALRALGRHWPGDLDAPLTQSHPSEGGLTVPVGDLTSLLPLPSAAAWIAMGFRTCFNRPETILLLRGLNRSEPYRRRVLDYCLDGNLQAVIDEFLHLLTKIWRTRKFGECCSP